MDRIIYGKDILDSVYALVGRLFERKYKEESEKSVSSGNTASSATSATNASDESGTLPNMSAIEEKVIFEFEERLPFLMASCCSELSRLDWAYRKAFGKDEQAEFSGFFIGIDDVFPLCDKFVCPVTLYCASMLIIDIDSEKSDSLFERYADSVSAISASIPFEIEKTVQKYDY